MCKTQHMCLLHTRKFFRLYPDDDIYYTIVTQLP